MKIDLSVDIKKQSKQIMPYDSIWSYTRNNGTCVSILGPLRTVHDILGTFIPHFRVNSNISLVPETPAVYKLRNVYLHVDDFGDINAPQ